MDRNVKARRLEGKTAVIIGAGSIARGWGNGKAAAVLFARHGANVVCVDVNDDAARETALLIERAGGEAIACQADATSSSDIERVLAKTLQTYGRVDVRHNNVGIISVSRVVDISVSEWDTVLNIN